MRLRAYVDPRRARVVSYLFVASVSLVAAGCSGPDGGDDPVDLSEDAGTSGDLTLSAAGAHAAAENACGARATPIRGTFKFTMTAPDSGGPLRPGGSGFDVDEVEATLSSGRVFEAPDLSCGESGEGSGVSCGLEGYACGRTVPRGSKDEVTPRCSMETGFGEPEVAFASDTSSDQRMAVLVENSASVGGFRPDPIGNGQFYYDADGDGTAEATEELYSSRTGETETNPVGAVAPGLASDPDNSRLAALESLVRTWNDVRSAAPDGVETSIGIWTIEGGVEPRSLLAGAASGRGEWRTELTAEAEELRALTEPETERANVLESAKSLLDEKLADDASGEAGLDDYLVLIVDGPPERTAAETGVGVDDVVAAAEEAGARIFVVQFDPERNADATVDDFAYFRAQEEACGSDGDCRAWETCREVRGWANEPGEVQRQYAVDGPRCMPARRERDGRFGPVSAYSRLACATGGGYQYVKAAGALRRAVEPLPTVMDGLWSVTAPVEAFESGRVSEAGSVPLQLQAEITTPNGEATHVFSQNGAAESSDSTAGADNRAVFFSQSRPDR